MNQYIINLLFRMRKLTIKSFYNLVPIKQNINHVISQIIKFRTKFKESIFSSVCFGYGLLTGVVIVVIIRTYG